MSENNASKADERAELTGDIDHDSAMLKGLLFAQNLFVLCNTGKQVDQQLERLDQTIARFQVDLMEARRERSAAALASTPSPLQAPAVVAEAAQLLGVPVSRDATMDEWALYKVRAYLHGIADDLRNGDRERHAAARLIDRLAGRQVAQPAVRARMLSEGEFEAGCGRFHNPSHVRAAIRKFCEVNGLPLSSEKGDGRG